MTFSKLQLSILFVFSILAFTSTFAQTQDLEVESTKTDSVMTFVDEMPQYPGGVSAMLQFISSNLHYPDEAAKYNISGRVLVRFVVKQDGRIGNIEVMNEVNPLLAMESIRVIRSMPKWSPGVLKGEKVPVYFTMPIMFKLPSTPKVQDEESGE